LHVDCQERAYLPKCHISRLQMANPAEEAIGHSFPDIRRDFDPSG
jgi:hypothetical protein